jgi:hypothetical protein
MLLDRCRALLVQCGYPTYDVPFVRITTNCGQGVRTRDSPYTWGAVEHREIDWVSRSPFMGEFEVVIMIAGVTEEMHGSD